MVLLEPGAVAIVNHVPKHLPEAADGVIAGNFIGLGDPLELAPGQRVEKSLAVLRDVKLPLPPVGHRSLLFDEPLAQQLAHRTLDVLMRDAKDGEQLSDSDPRGLRYEIENPVMRSPEAELRELAVGIFRQVQVREEMQFETAVQGLCRRRGRVARG